MSCHGRTLGTEWHAESVVDLASMNVFIRRQLKPLLWLIPLLLCGTFGSTFLFGSADLSADSPVNLDANTPLTENDRQLRVWILGLFESIKPNDEHRMFLELSLQDANDQYQCRYLIQADGSIDVVPELAADPNAEIRAFTSWYLRFDENADIGIDNEL